MIDIKKFRKEQKLTQVEFGKKIGYTHAYISNVENGKEPVTDNFLNKMHEVFGIEVEEYKSYNQKVAVSDPGKEYNSEWKERYYELLEKYNRCLEEKDGLAHKPKLQPE